MYERKNPQAVNGIGNRSSGRFGDPCRKQVKRSEEEKSMKDRNRAIVMKISGLSQKQAGTLLGRALTDVRTGSPSARVIGATQDSQHKLVDHRRKSK